MAEPPEEDRSLAELARRLEDAMRGKAPKADSWADEPKKPPVTVPIPGAVPLSPEEQEALSKRPTGDTPPQGRRAIQYSAPPSRSSGSFGVPRPGPPAAPIPTPLDITTPSATADSHRTLHEELEPAANASDAGLQKGAAGHKASTSDKWIAQFFEFAGLGFILGPPGFLGEALLKSEAINWVLMAAIFVGFWAIGGISLAAGLTWPAWKPTNKVGVAVIEKAASSVWIWISIVLAIAFGPALLVAGFSKASVTSAPSTPVVVTPTPAPPFFNEATPHAPPKLGPLATLRMVDSIAAKANALSPSDFIDQKWALVITSPRENDEIAQIVRGIVGSKLAMIPIPPPNPNDLDAPQLISAPEPGITLHGNNQLNDRLFHELGSCFNVKKTSRSPDNLQSWYVGHVPNGFQVDWIDIGRGAPWKEPFPPQCSQ